MRSPTLVVALVLALLGASSAYGSAARTTSVRAEVALLGAPRALQRLHPGLVDARRNVVRDNTMARCTGRGRPVRGAHSRFVCTVRRETVAIRVLYVAKPRNGFDVRRLRP